MAGGRAWGFMRAVAAAEVVSVGNRMLKPLRWLVVVLVGLALAVVYAGYLGFAAVVAWVFHGTGSWQQTLASGVALWVLVKLVPVAFAVRRGSARTARAIVTGLSRGRRIRRRWESAAAATKLLGRPDAPSVIAPARGWRPTARGGVRHYVAYGAVARTPGELQQACLRLPQQFNAARCRPVFIPGHTLGCDLEWEWGDDLSRVWTFAEVWDLAQRQPLLPGQVPIGVTERGLLGTLDANKTVLLGGLTEMGKSSAIWGFLAGCMILGIRLRLHILDPKGGIEFGKLAPLLGRKDGPIIVHSYLDDDREARTDAAYAPGGFWAEIERIQTEKERHLKRLGLRQLALGTDQWLDVVIVDELLSVINDPHFSPSNVMDHPLARVSFRGRVVNVMGLLCSQEGTKTTIGPLRDLIAQRLAFKTPSPDATDVILRAGATKAGATAHELDMTADKGVCFGMGEGVDGFVRQRIGYVSDSVIDQIAAGVVPDFAGQLAAVAPTRPCYVYQAVFAQDVEHEGRVFFAGQLAYVGIAYDPAERWAQHRADPQEWWAEFCEWEVVREYDRPVLGMAPRDQALVAEEDLIRSQRPVFNTTHNRDNPDRVAWKGKRRQKA